MDADAALVQGREAGQRRAWTEAYSALNAVASSGRLTGEDLELLACAAYLLGHLEECHRALQRAHQRHMKAGDRARAARCVFWVAFTLLLQGDVAQAGGWMGRANRILKDGPKDCPERGLLLLPESVQAAAAGDHERAEQAAARAAEIGTRTGDADVLALALHFQGRAQVKLGRIGDGVALLDEAMVAVVAGEVWPPVAGNIYCSMIDACQEIFDLRRADEWTGALSAWWQLQPDMVTFTGQCLVHRAEILQMRGALPQAVQESRRACERFAHAADTYATGAAWYRQAEVLRVLGDYAAAAAAYREASQWGHEPQPGLAMLWHVEGKTTAADAAIRRAVGEATDRFRRARLLPALVEIALAGGDIAAARAAANELVEIARILDVPALQAVAAHAIGAVLFADDDANGALASLRRAWDLWRDLNVPYEAATVRVRIGLGCRALGDEDSAALEIDAAARVFRELGARPALEWAVSFVRSQVDPSLHGLSGREMQVLRLLAHGKTNRAIAMDLTLAPKTVDRHVTNIFSKLGVSSRAAATAYAYEHRLIA